MKQLALASVPVLLAGFLFLSPVIDLPWKSGQSQVESTRHVPVVNTLSVDSCHGVPIQEQTVSQTETDNDNSLLYKNIIVCLL